MVLRRVEEGEGKIGEEKGRESEEGVRIGEPFGDILTRVATD